VGGGYNQGGKKSVSGEHYLQTASESRMDGKLKERRAGGISATGQVQTVMRLNVSYSKWVAGKHRGEKLKEHNENNENLQFWWDAGFKTGEKG